MGSGVQVMASQKQIEVKYQQAQKTAVRPTLKHSALFSSEGFILQVEGTCLGKSQAADMNVREPTARSSTRHPLLMHAWEGLESALIMLMVPICA